MINVYVYKDISIIIPIVFVKNATKPVVFVKVTIKMIVVIVTFFNKDS